MGLRHRLTLWIWVGFVALGLSGCNPRQGDAGPTEQKQAVSDDGFSTNLPIVIVDTLGQWIPDEPKIHAKLRILHNASGGRNTLDSSHVDFEGDIGIEIRGQSSKQYPKKQYGFELRSDEGKNIDASLLGLPADSDWILHAPYSDKTLMRNFLAYHFSNVLGQYAPRAKFVELFLNMAGDADIGEQHYAGVYLLMERIKRGKQRVNIDALKPTADKAPDITGGYILKTDKLDWTDRYFYTDSGTQFICVYPKSADITDLQEAWIREHLNQFETALQRSDFSNPKRGYAQYIDTDSFIDYVILNELFKNIDAYRLSAYVHKPKAGKLRMGPVWDFNLSMGNADYYEGWHEKGWIFNIVPRRERFLIPFWWKRLLQDPHFARQLIQRWETLRQRELATPSVMNTVEQTVKILMEAQARNFRRWPVLGRYVWPNPRPYPRTYDEEVKRLKTWLRDRLTWMDRNIASLAPQ